MGLRRSIKAAVDHARDVVENLEDQVDHWRDVAAREHDRRVEGLADAEIAIAEAKSNTAIIKAESRAAAAEAEARGVARGTVEGYQRALDENEIFDAGFEGGGRRRESMSNAPRSTHVSGSQARSQGPSPSLGNRKYMTDRNSTSITLQSRTSGSSTLRGSRQYMSERSGRPRHDPPSVERSGNHSIYHQSSSQGSSSQRSTHHPEEKTNGSERTPGHQGNESCVDSSYKPYVTPEDRYFISDDMIDSTTSTGKNEPKKDTGQSAMASTHNTGDSRAKRPTTKSGRSGDNSTTARKQTVGKSRAELPTTKSSRSGPNGTTASKPTACNSRAEMPATKSSRPGENEATPSQRYNYLYILLCMN